MTTKNLLNFMRQGVENDYEATPLRVGHKSDSIVSRFCVVSLICVLMLTLGVGNAWGYTGTFTKYTNSTLIDGYYVIGASESSSNSSYCVGTTVSSGRITGTSLSTSNPANNIVWIIENTASGWTFNSYGSSTKYIRQYRTNSGGGMEINTTIGYFTLAGYNSSSPKGFRFTSADQNSNKFFKWNNSNKWFSNYANAYDAGMAPVTLYRDNSKYRAKTTQPATGSFSASATSATWDGTKKHLSWMSSGATVTLTAAPPSGKVVNAWTVTKATGGTVTVTSTGANTATFSMPTDQVTVTVTWKDDVATPTITPSVSELDWGTVAKGAVLTTKTFTITGTNLTSAALVYSASGGYSVSPSGKAGAAGSLASQTLTVTPPSTATPGTYNSTVSITGGGLASAVTVDVKLTVENTDAFIDEVQSTSGYTSGSPHIEQGSYSTPSLSDKSVATSGTCEQVHYHFVGWITAAKYEAGTSISDGDLQTPTSATGATYYAVWAKQAAGGGGDVTDVINKALVDDANSSIAGGSNGTWYEITVDGSNSEAKYFIRTMGRNNTNTYAVRWNTNGYLYCSTAPKSGLKLKSITATTTSDKSLNLFGSTSKYSAKATATSLGSLSATSSGVTYSLTSAQLADNYTCVGINGAASSTEVVSISITYSGGTSYEDYIAKCCTALGSINGSVSCTSGTAATLTWSSVTGAESYKVKVPGSSSHNDWTTATSGVSVTGLTAGQNYTAYFKPFDSNGSHCTEGPESTTAFTTPQITTTGTPSTMTYAEGGGPSSAESFVVKGKGLCGANSGQLTVTAPTNFEVSLDNSSWGDSKTITKANAESNSGQTVYVRLKAGLLNANSPFGPSNVVISGGNAASVNVSVSGTVSSACSVPTIGNPSLTNITGTTITVSCPTISGGTNCDVDEYGFIWKAGSAPTMALYDGKKKTGENNQSTAYNDGLSIDVANNTGTTYYIKAYAHNSEGNNVSSTALQVTPRSVTFNSNGGSAVATKYVNSGTKVTAPDAPTKTGYDFGAWQQNSSTFDFANTNVSENITLVATWTVHTHTLTWSWGGGSTSSTTYTLYPNLSGSVNYDATITKPADNTMSKTGYTFSSWSSSAATMPDNNLTITAQWTAKTTAITLNKNNNDASGSTAGTASWTYDQTTKNSITAATRTGYNVDGYYTAASDGTKILNADGSLAGNSITVDAVVYTSGGKWAYDGTSLTLYAHWTLKTTTVSFNQNSGTGGQTTTKTATYSQAMPTPITTPTRAGYTFTGYFENSGGTGTKYYNADGSSATNWNKENSTWTLYAGWTAKEDTYKTALHTGASGWTSYASGVTKSGAGYTIPAPSSVAKGATSTCEDTHYHFAGWVADDYKGSPSGHIITATGTTDATGTTYWAVWEKEKAGSAGAAVNTLLWGETWTSATVSNGSSGQSSANPDDNCSTSKGTTIYDDASITYTQSNESNVYCRNENTGGGTAPELFIKGSNTWTISGIKTGKGTALSLTYKSNKSPTVAVSTSELGKSPSITGSAKDYTIDPDGASTIQLVFSASENSRVDDVELRVATAGVTYEDPKAVCEACVATPSISGVELTGSAFSTTSVPVQATGASAGENCSLAEYGFYWGGSANPTTNETASDNLSTGTFSATLTGPFTIGTTYHYRAFGTNEADNTGYSSDASFTLQNVSFSMHGHGGDAPATQVVPRGLKATAPSTPSETGYTFDGWWDNSSYTGSAWDFSTNTVGSGNVTLHAKWTEKPKYTITLNAGNGTISDANWTNTSGSTYTRTQSNGDEEITLPTPSCNCAGWVFQGWSTTSKDNAASFTPDKEDGASFVPADNVTYYAVYRANATGGTTFNKITSTGDLTTGNYIFMSSTGYAMKNVETSSRMDEVGGYTASNSSQTIDNANLVWTIAKFSSQVVIKNGANYLGIDADNNICLTTTPHFFTYTYNGTNNRWEFTSATKTSYQLVYSSYFKILTSQSTAIYLFKQGAGLTGNYYTNPDCSDISVTGTVSPVGSGTVTLTASSGKTGDKVYAMYTPDEDYNFDEWTISGTGSTLGSTSAVVTEITIGTANTTVTANFVAKDWKTVTWKANGVALTGEDLGSASVKVENGFDITALPPSPDPCDGTSTTFIGWVEESDIWSGPTDDVSGVTIYEDVSDFPTVTDDVTYHAVWARQNGSAAPATYAGTGVFTKITTLEELEVGAHYVLYGIEDANPTTVCGAMNNSFINEASGKNVFGVSSVTISDNKITNPATTIVWKLGGTTDAYTLYSQNSSKYVEITANDTRGYTNPSSATTSFTITVSEGNFKIITNYASANSRMINIYSASAFRAYSYLSEGYTLNLYKYGSNYTYDRYLVKCCEDPELAFDGEYNYQTLVRQDIHGARGGNGSATVEQGKATLVLDYVTESDGTCTVEVKKLTGGDNRSTAAAGSDCSNHTNIAINQSTKKVTFDIWTYAPSYPTANGQGTYRIKITQDAASTYCASEAYYFVDVTLRDKFVDAVNGNATINVDGQSKSTSDKCKTPTEASLDADKNDDCHSTTRRFLGWVREDSMDTWYGSSSDRTRDLDDKKDDAALVAPNADIITTGSTWYAVWGIEE